MAMRVFCVYFALADEHLAIVAAVVPHECRSPTCSYICSYKLKLVHSMATQANITMPWLSASSQLLRREQHLAGADDLGLTCSYRFLQAYGRHAERSGCSKTAACAAGAGRTLPRQEDSPLARHKPPPQCSLHPLRLGVGSKASLGSARLYSSSPKRAKATKGAGNDSWRTRAESFERGFCAFAR